LTVVERASLGSLYHGWYYEGMSDITSPKYPHINIPLVGEDGNAFSILGRVQRIMKQNGLRDEVEAFHAEATSGNYDNLLLTVMRWFSVDSQLDDDYEDDWDEDEDDDF